MRSQREVRIGIVGGRAVRWTAILLAFLLPLTFARRVDAQTTCPECTVGRLYMTNPTGTQYVCFSGTDPNDPDPNVSQWSFTADDFAWPISTSSFLRSH